MSEETMLMEAFDARVRRREERRDLFKAVLGVAAVGAGFAFASPAAAQAVTDNDILNFALNLEYLEAQFYSYAFNGTGLAPAILTGSGTPGTVATGGTNPPRKVDFTGEPLIAQYAREIAQDEINHVNFLRTALTSANATAYVAQPAINISGDANGPFTAAAIAAGIDLTASGGVFDPYASPNNFLLGSFIFEDVGVTAYKGSSTLIQSATILDAAAGILAVEAFHAGIIRGALYARGVATPELRTNADKISDARDGVDGNTNSAATAVPRLYGDDDQGVSPMQVALTSSAGTTTATASNFAPTDANGIAFGRTAQQVLNVVYLNRNQVTMGGFFPNGVNGTIRTSAAN